MYVYMLYRYIHQWIYDLLFVHHGGMLQGQQRITLMGLDGMYACISICIGNIELYTPINIWHIICASGCHVAGADENIALMSLNTQYVCISLFKLNIELCTPMNIWHTVCASGGHVTGAEENCPHELEQRGRPRIIDAS